MRYRQIFLLFVAFVLVGFSLLKIFPKWVIYFGLLSLVTLGADMIVQGIKSKIAAKPFRPTIEDLQYQDRKKAEAAARKKYLEDERERLKQSDGF